MKRTRHTAEKLIRKLTTAEQLTAQGKTNVKVCHVIKLTEETYHGKRQQYGRKQPNKTRKLTQPAVVFYHVCQRSGSSSRC